MKGIVVDASVTLSWCFPEEQTQLCLETLDRLKAGEQVMVPAFWSAEVLNALLVGERKGRISAALAQAFLEDLRALRPLLDDVPLEHIFGQIQTLCRIHNLTPYDALYVELALRLRCPLATLDHAQRDAASALGVECL